MKHIAWAILLGSVISGCASDTDTKPSFSLEPDAQPNRSRPLVIDPVCGEVVDPSTPLKAVYRDNVYTFHSDGCRERFAADPDTYAFGPVPTAEPRVYGKRVYYPDPVCGREVPSSTRWWAEHDGHAYFFHDQECLLEFRFHPQAYVAPEQRIEAK